MVRAMLGFHCPSGDKTCSDLDDDCGSPAELSPTRILMCKERINHPIGWRQEGVACVLQMALVFLEVFRRDDVARRIQRTRPSLYCV